MNREHGRVDYGKQSIDFVVLRRKRTTLEIAVEPDATVVVVAPLAASLEAITEKVRKRASWVRRQQQFFLQFVPRTPPRNYVSGETHLYLGRQYRLKVIASEAPGVKLWRGFISVQSEKPKRFDVTRDLMNSWYRNRAYVKFTERLEINLARFPNPEKLRPKGLIVRQLRQRWGSMSPGHRMLLNQRLIQAPLGSIDYVITHELCHVAAPNHGPAFFRLLNRVLPDWQSRKQRLESLMS
jgi:predicted metal-dependent hydrolase